MTKNKLFGLLGLALVFMLVSFLLWTHLDHALWIFPAYGILFVWADFCRENEMQIIFVFLVTMIGLLLLSRAPAVPVYAGGILTEVLVIWAIIFSLSSQRKRGDKTVQSVNLEVQAHNKTVQGIHRDIDSYSRHQQSLLHQNQLQSNLSGAVQSLAGAMNMDDIRSSLVHFLGRYFPDAACQLAPGAPRDALEIWASQRNMPLLVHDLQADKRFPPIADVRSVIVAPLHVLQRIIGFIRLSSPKPGAFQIEDLRTTDLLGTLAALAMENAELYSKVQELAIHDGLTQLFTHRAFQQRLGEEVLRAGRSQVPFSMFIGDIDHFKRYNDNFGHQAGDSVLKTVASLLVRCTRGVDFVARYGGEEFAVILPAVSGPDADQVAQGVRLAVEREPFVFEGNRTGVTMSFGVSSFPHDAITASQLVRAADERLYRAKENGRNLVVGRT